MLVLGIETSCDETSVAVVRDDKTILSNIVHSQLKLTRKWGGVVPELSARAHLDLIAPTLAHALEEANVSMKNIDAVAVTAGPGLIGGLIVGVMAAKGLSMRHNKPFLAVNHLEGHALTQRLIEDIDFPYLLLLVSGGHCQILIVKAVGLYQRLGTTIDDSAGEAFDKTAKLLGLPMPGGPAIEALATNGNAKRFPLPSPMLGRAHCDFSFSGLKTAVRRQVERLENKLKEQDKKDLCASFQAALCQTLCDRVNHAFKIVQRNYAHSLPLVIAGGVSANKMLATELKKHAQKQGISCRNAPLTLCTDNAAMIAWAGLEHYRLGGGNSLDFAPRPHWPLDPNAPPSIFAGAKKA